jgi:hypothetical protein
MSAFPVRQIQNRVATVIRYDELQRIVCFIGGAWEAKCPVDNLKEAIIWLNFASTAKFTSSLRTVPRGHIEPLQAALLWYAGHLQLNLTDPANRINMWHSLSPEERQQAIRDLGELMRESRRLACLLTNA